MDNTNRPSIRIYVGGTGSGKGASVRAHLKDERPKRLIVWDPQKEYGAFCKTRTADMEEVVRQLDKPEFSIAFIPGDNAAKFALPFRYFCRLAYAAGNLTMLVEELADVTTASHAPQPWSRCIRSGRHRGLRIVACTQRPASVDKTTLGNATYVRVFQLNWPDDMTVMSKLVRAPYGDVEALVTTEDDRKTVINYIERDKRTGKTTPGRITLTRK